MKSMTIINETSQRQRHDIKDIIYLDVIRVNGFIDII